MRHDDRIDLRVPEGTKTAWETEAERRGLALSEAIRRAVPYFFEHHQPERVRRPRAKAA